MSDAAIRAIDLTQQPDFSLAALLVRPSTLEVERDGAREVLEPRVMQVLVAMHQAYPNVISRDTLIAQCWEGRIVGDDAINRAIGRLRRLAETDGGASFSIETIPRVGYRLVIAGAPPVVSDASVATSAKPDRRWLVGGAAAAVLATAGGIAVWRTEQPPPTPPPSSLSPDVQALMVQGIVAMHEHTVESVTRAISMFEHATQAAPNSANAWGLLGLCYAFASHYAPSSRDAMVIRAHAAIARTRALDPRNASIWMTQSELLPAMHTWLARDKLVEAGLKFHPNNDGLLESLALARVAVGRVAEAADLIVRACAAASPARLDLSWIRFHLLWVAGRQPEADVASVEAIALYPRQTYVWFSRLYMMMFTGRLTESLAVLADSDNWPPGSPAGDFEDIALVATALKTRAKADIDRAVTVHLDRAHRGAGYAENAMQFVAALGAVDQAFAIADALYLGRGFDVGAFRFGQSTAIHMQLDDRRTQSLFYPPTQAMRGDPRFAVLMDEIGLTKYWRDSGSQPDYQKDLK